MTNTINRRQALTGVAAIAAGAAVANNATAQTLDPDQNLIDLWEKWRSLQRVMLDASYQRDIASSTARKEYPDQPESLKSKHLSTFGKVVDRGDIEFNRDFITTHYPPSTHAAIDAIHDATMKIYDEWEAEKAKIDQRHNVPALEQALSDILAEQKIVETEFHNTPSTGLTGILVKLTFWSFWTYDGGDNFMFEPPLEELAVQSVFKDLRRMTGKSFTTTV